MNHSRRRFFGFALTLFLLTMPAAPAAAVDPGGSVTLADGRVLPPAPPEMMEPSIHGSMLLEHPQLPADVKKAPSLQEAGGTLQAVDGTLAGGNGPAGPLPGGLRKEVLGFLPYWMLDAGTLSSMRYDRVSTIAYFSIGANANGSLVQSGSGWSGWTSSALSGVISQAHARGVRVVPTITMMAWSGNYDAMTTLLQSASNRAQFVSEVAGIIGNRGADGVNIDFEPVPTSLRGAFTTLIRELKAGLLKAKVGSYLTVDTMAGAATWATGYDVVALTASGAADALMVMAYDFSWSGSSRAGGVSPLESPYIFDVTDAVADYLDLVDGSKLIWGIPYYGRTWATQSDALNSRTCASDPSKCPGATSLTSKAYYYTGALSQSEQYGRRWDSVGGVPWYRWYDTPNKTWRQGYYDDAQSLDLKYRLVLDNGLAGIGIWTLLMDAGHGELNDVIEDRFVRTAVRLAGNDRYATAADVSRRLFAPDRPVAFVTAAADFPDALSAGPAAAKLGGPLLLVTRDGIPASTATELRRLKPRQIVVLGGTGVVSNAVAAQLAQYTPGTIRRLAGANRFETAAEVSAAYFSPGIKYAFVATGVDYPDALAGVAYAASVHAPMLLTNPTGLPAATKAELKRLSPRRIIVLGGPGAVSDNVRDALKAYASVGVTRIWGADRYETAVAISATAFGADVPWSVFVATGQNFPDGLAGAAAAGVLKAPLLLVPQNALPDSVAGELRRVNAPHTYVLGQSGAISNDVVKRIRRLWD